MCIYSELYESLPNEGTGEVLYKVAHGLCSIQAQEMYTEACDQVKDLSDVIQQLANKAIIICKPGMTKLFSFSISA